MHDVRFRRYASGALLGVSVGRVHASVAVSREGRISFAAMCTWRPKILLWSAGRR